MCNFRPILFEFRFKPDESSVVAFHTSALHSLFIKFQPRYESDTELGNRANLGGFQSVLFSEF